MKKFILFILLVVIAIALYSIIPQTPPSTIPAPVATTPAGDPTFAWTYTSVMDRDFPKTRVTLTATYPNGAVVTKDIDTADGSCNDYADPDTDVYPKSTMIICYGAGFGTYYKVVQADTAYVVMQKSFEEGSPEYNPPAQSFQEVARF